MAASGASRFGLDRGTPLGTRGVLGQITTPNGVQAAVRMFSAGQKGDPKTAMPIRILRIRQARQSRVAIRAQRACLGRRALASLEGTH